MPDGTLPPRWLDAEAVARHVSIRPDYVARYVKSGKLPKPRYPFGPRQPRWDREEVDAWMTGRLSSTPHNAAVQALADDIARKARRHAHRPQATR
jgi:predicted DNA-binding transcriptional regulator AlpA